MSSAQSKKKIGGAKSWQHPTVAEKTGRYDCLSECVKLTGRVVTNCPEFFTNLVKTRKLAVEVYQDGKSKPLTLMVGFQELSTINATSSNPGVL